MTQDELNQIRGVVREEIEPLKQDLSGLRQDVSALKEDVTTLKKGVSTLKQDVSTLKEDMVVVKKDVSSLKGDVNTLKGDVATLKEDVTSLKKGQETLTLQVEVINRNQQRAGRQSQADHQEIMERLVKIADISGKDDKALERRVDRIERHLTCNPRSRKAGSGQVPLELSYLIFT